MAKMTAERWERIKELFDASVDLPPAERVTYLDRECRRDEQLRAEVESLVAAHEKPGSFLRGGALGAMTQTVREQSLVSGSTMAPGSEERFLPGAVFAGRYRIISLVGQGGMGEVYRAHDLQLKQTIALKLLPSSNRDALERFRNEVRTAREVTHPNVCRVFDIGEIKDAAYLTMEYIDGEDLASLLLRIGRLSEDKALEIAQQVCAGLQAAHDKGIVHRDLKPGNIMLDGRGQARITDFGLAALAEIVEGREARHGTPLYMAPEQLAGKEATARSDIYALGLILFEMFTGRRPFEASSSEQLSELRATTPVPHPSNTIANLSPAVERTILRCLEPDPKQRPASVSRVAAALLGKESSAGLTVGVTPTSEALRDVGQMAAIRPAIALTLLVFAVVGMPLVAYWGNQVGWLAADPFVEQPEVIKFNARQLVASLGYPAPIDSQDGFVSPRPVRGESTREIEFWYRQAPCMFDPDRMPSGIGLIPPGRVGPNNPEDACAGDVNMFFNRNSKLTRLRAVPPAQAVGALDWSKLFAAAGLTFADFRSVAPGAAPTAAFDSQYAWEGPPGSQNRPIHVEAATWRGTPVYFTVGPDTYYQRAIIPTSRPGIHGNYFINQTTLIFLILIATVLTGALLLVRHNLRLRRGDRRGGFVIARFMFVLSMLVWLSYATLRLTLFMAGVFFVAIGWALMMAAGVWVLYMAVDPYVRRRWPQTVISLHRLLDGPVTDPLIARDVLFGMAAAVVEAGLYVSKFHLMHRLGEPAPMIPQLSALSGLRSHISGTLFDVQVAVWMVFFVFGFVFLLRLLLRRTWLALAGYVLLWTFVAAGASGHPLADVPIDLIHASFTMFVLFRLGVCAWIVTNFVAPILWAIPVTFDLSQWYAMPSLVLLAGLIAVTTLAYRLAVPRTELISDKMLYR